MKTFICKSCQQTFTAKGNKVNWKSPIYGPSWKYTAKCPACKSESNEYVPVSKSKGSGSSAASSSSASCPTGTCPFVAN